MSLIKWEEVTDDFERIFDVIPSVPFSKMSHYHGMDTYTHEGAVKTKTALFVEKRKKTRFK